jgi:hypothetical protein
MRLLQQRFRLRLLSYSLNCEKKSKGQCHAIFDLWFFSSNNPAWAPDARVKALLHMASNSRSYKTKSVPQQCQLHRWCLLSGFSYANLVQNHIAQRYHWNCWCRTSSVIDTASAALAVLLTQLVPRQRCHWHCLCRGPRIREALAGFKGNINKKKIHRQIVLPNSYKITLKNIEAI